MTDKERAEIDELRATVARLAVDVARLTGQGLQKYEVVKLGGLHDALYVPRPCGWCIGWVMIGGQYRDVELLVDGHWRATVAVCAACYEALKAEHETRAAAPTTGG